MAGKTIFLIDATAFCYRAFYAISELSTSFGQPTNAIYGFLNILNKILKSKKPEYIAACFDVSRETFRTKKFKEYKLQRPPTPDALLSQFQYIKEIISAYGIAIFEKEGFEADDVIATLSDKAKRKGFSVVVISSDKDILQLVDEKVSVFNPHKEDGVTYSKENVCERFGVGPESIADIIALMGDDIDNIPGVPGIGEKTAAALISEFGTLDKMLSNINKIKQEKIRKSISENIQTIKRNKELAVLVKDIDIEFMPEELRSKEPNFNELSRIFKFLEFKKFIKELPGQDKEEAVAGPQEIADKDARSILAEHNQIYISGLLQDKLVFGVGNRIFSVSNIGDNVKAILDDGKIGKIGHDLKKIKTSLAKNGVVMHGLYFDTMIAGYLLNPSKPGYALEDLAFDYLGENIREPFSPQKEINMLFSLKSKLEDALVSKSLTELFNKIEMPLVDILAQMELNGIKLDLKLLSELSKEIEKRLIKLIDNIYDISGCQFNINSPKQLRDILFDKLKLPIVKKSKTGPSTDEEVLRKLAGKHKLPELLLEYRQLMKLKTTYVDVLPTLVDKKDGLIHTSFNQAVTETGRLSSSNPNLQNIPVKTDIGKMMRKAVIASKENNLLLASDYSQVELRILAHLSGDDNLISEFKEDKDIHRATAALIYGVREKDVTGEMRETAKRVNFGIVYGLTSYGLSRDLGISPDEAGGFIDAYFSRYPKVKDYIQEQIKLAGKQGFVTTILGRRRYIPEINNKNQGIRQFSERQAVNTPIQGSASDLIKLAMIELDRELNVRKLKTKMVLQVHDELVFDVVRPELEEVAELVKDRMENVLKLKVPIKVQLKKGKNWLEMEEVK